MQKGREGFPLPLVPARSVPTRRLILPSLIIANVPGLPVDTHMSSLPRSKVSKLHSNGSTSAIPVLGVLTREQKCWKQHNANSYE